MGVSGCGPDGAMAEQGLNQPDVGVCFGQVGRIGVAQGMKGNVLVDAGLFSLLF